MPSLFDACTHLTYALRLVPAHHHRHLSGGTSQPRAQLFYPEPNGAREATKSSVVLGLTTASIFWVVVVLAGLATLLSQHPWLATGVRLVGAAYLVWYGAGLLWSAMRPAPASTNNAAATAPDSPRASYRTGLLTGMTNPKGAAFWTSAFAALMPVAPPTWFYMATVALVAVLSLTWHWGITAVFGTQTLRNGYLRIERGVNGVAGAALVGMGIQRYFAR